MMIFLFGCLYSRGGWELPGKQALAPVSGAVPCAGGNTGFFINSRQYTLKPNDFVIVNPNEIHSIECPDPNITIVLQIPMKSFEGYMSDESRITFADKDESQKARLVAWSLPCTGRMRKGNSAIA